MTEPRPEYTVRTDDRQLPPHDDRLKDYLWKRRELIIAELRWIYRALGRPQTIPERVR